ncbi:hypothetical protein [Pedobacter heparinus]|uniref:hypothetical protein n=1 Tax=Pedobacter heparinus TaxID=984 RepID=UPI00292D3CDE|nr:hypothetical protein [Pedobacter heparinus]
MEELHIGQIGEWFHNEGGFDFHSEQNMHEYDFIVIDTDTLVDSVKECLTSKVDRRIADLKEFIQFKNIPVVFICFSGSSFMSMLAGKSKTIPDLLGLDAIEIPSTGRKIEVNPDSLLKDFMKKYINEFEYQVSFSNHPGTSIGKAKSKPNSIGFYTRDYIFIPGLSEDCNIDETVFLRELYDIARLIRKGDDALHIPNWANNYLLPGEKEEKENFRSLENEINRLQKAKAESELRLSNYLPLKQLWSGSGFALENAVKQVFLELGFVMLPTHDRRDDLIMKYNNQIVIVEIKGQNKSAAEKNAAQLEKFVSTYIADNDGTTPKGLLIVNTFKDEPLNARKEVSFPHQMLNYSRLRSHCLITTLQLCSLLLFCRKNPKQHKAAIDGLLATVGCFEGHDNWSEYISVEKPVTTKKIENKKVQVLS